MLCIRAVAAAQRAATQSIRSRLRPLQAAFRLIAIHDLAYHQRPEERGEMKAKRDERPAELDPTTRAAIVRALVEHGVMVVDPDRTYVGEGVEVAPGTVLYPGTHLRGRTSVASECRIGPDTWIEDSTIEPGATVRYSVVEGSRVRAGSNVGPYAHLRPGADIGPEARIGNFVEVKAARIEHGVKAGHLAYIGDAQVGPEANIGAGTVTCNYDGAEKHRTVIESGAFIGSNTALVAPVTIGEDAVVAAGSTITDDVPPRSKAFGRARQVNKPGTSEEGTSHDR